MNRRREVLPRQTVNRYLAHKQHLLPGSRLADVLQATRDVVGLHATSATGPYLSLWARMSHFRREMLEEAGCEVLEVASTPTFTDTIDKSPYYEAESWNKLKALELEVCTVPELLGMGHHLLFVARKV